MFGLADIPRVERGCAPLNLKGNFLEPEYPLAQSHRSC